MGLGEQHTRAIKKNRKRAGDSFVYIAINQMNGITRMSAKHMPKINNIKKDAIIGQISSA
jgi:hypothetical protein